LRKISMVVKGKILIFDSDPLEAKRLESYLLACGYETIITADKDNSLEIIGRQDIDLVLLDLASVGIEGIEICGYIKSQQASKGIPVVIVVSPEDRQTRMWSLKSNIDDFVSTPIDKTELGLRVDSLVRIKRLYKAGEKSEIKLKEVETLKDSLKSMITGQINTFITAIKNHLDLVVDEVGLSNTAKSNIEFAREYTDELFTLASDFYGLVKIEEGALKPHFENTDINVMIMHSIEQLKFIAKKSGVSLTNTTASQPVYFEVDRALILRIIINFVITAIKFTTHGGDIGIGASLDQNKLCICVEYTGKGIPLEYREKIFYKFFQIDNPILQIKKINSFGLAFSKSAVEFLGGSIWYESLGDEKGGKFIASIPAHK